MFKTNSFRPVLKHLTGISRRPDGLQTRRRRLLGRFTDIMPSLRGINQQRELQMAPLSHCPIFSSPCVVGYEKLRSFRDPKSHPNLEARTPDARLCTATMVNNAFTRQRTTNGPMKNKRSRLRLSASCRAAPFCATLPRSHCRDPSEVVAKRHMIFTQRDVSPADQSEEQTGLTLTYNVSRRCDFVQRQWIAK
ncbi:hypothetical protein QTP88_002568 [Uroleucon formosanum]